jgi:rhodanese-related sulfurtransferase
MAIVAFLAAVPLLVAGCGGSDGEPAAAAPGAGEIVVAGERALAPRFNLTEGDFAPGGKYVSADEVKRELDRGAELILLDARLGAYFAASHIPGAVSIPYYEVEDRLDELPKDTWIVAYCSGSGTVTEATSAVKRLLASGYENVAVLDEGYPGWESRGYPTTAA